jgi:hypothetical protein
MDEKRNAHRILMAKAERKRLLGRRRRRREKILKWITERYDWTVWTGSIWLRVGTSRGLF